MGKDVIAKLRKIEMFGEDIVLTVSDAQKILELYEAAKTLVNSEGFVESWDFGPTEAALKDLEKESPTT